MADSEEQRERVRGAAGGLGGQRPGGGEAPPCTPGPGPSPGRQPLQSPAGWARSALSCELFFFKVPGRIQQGGHYLYPPNGRRKPSREGLWFSKARKALGDDGPRVSTQVGLSPKLMLLPHPTFLFYVHFTEGKTEAQEGEVGCRDTRLIDNRRSHGLSLYYAEARTPVSDPDHVLRLTCSFHR